MDAASPEGFVSYLPERVFYYSNDGHDLWCRRPYTFFFTSEERAERFLKEVGSDYALTLLAIDRGALLSPEFLGGLRQLQVSRLFLDPELDPSSGDIFGRILRLEASS